MNKQVLILTGTTDEFAFNTSKDNKVFYHHLNDNTMEEVFELTLPSKQRYAKKYGYDLLTMRSFKNGNMYGFNKDFDMGFLRAVRTFEMLKYYDFVMWVDADAIITNHIPITDFPMKDKSFCASYDWEWRNSFSTGNFIVQRTKDSDQLFDLFLHMGKQNSGRLMQEQEVLNFIHKNTSYGSMIEVIEHKYLGAVPSFIIETPTWKSHNRKGVISPWDEGCFLAHLTGCSNRDRIDLLNNKFAKYL